MFDQEAFARIIRAIFEVITPTVLILIWGELRRLVIKFCE